MCYNRELATMNVSTFVKLKILILKILYKKDNFVQALPKEFDLKI